MISNIVKSKRFRGITTFLAVVFMFATFVLTLDPRPFVKFGYLGAFVFSLFGTGIIIVPVLARYMNLALLSLLVALGMAINDTVGWYVGRRGDVVFPRSKRVIRAEETLHKYGPYGLVLFAFMPLPYDFFGVIAGYLEFPFLRFVIPTFVGRFARFMLLGSGSIAIWGVV